MDHKVGHRDRRQPVIEWHPAYSPVDGRPHTDIGPGKEQVAIFWVLPDNPDRETVGKVSFERFPTLSVILGPEKIGAEIIIPVSVEAGVSCALLVVGRLNPADEYVRLFR